jgi:exopolysaccharide biosynthesis protein
MSTLATLMRDLGAVQPINLHGGGSTARTIEDYWIGDGVNSPSGDGSSAHRGERSVGDRL